LATCFDHSKRARPCFRHTKGEPYPAAQVQQRLELCAVEREQQLRGTVKAEKKSVPTQDQARVFDLYKPRTRSHLSTMHASVKSDSMDTRMPPNESSSPRQREMVTTSPSLYSPSNDAIFLEPFEDGLTPLIREIKAGSVENVVALIESGTSIVEAGGFSFARVPLFYVAAGDHVEIVRMLIRHSAYMGYFESPLKEAVRRGHWDLVKLLVEGGANFHLDMVQHVKDGQESE
jgi:hypothetical protein